MTVHRTDITRYSGLIAIFLTIAYTSITLFIILLPNASHTLDFLLSKEFAIPYWTTVGTLFIAFVVDKTISNHADLILRLERPFQGVELYHNADDFLKALMEYSIDAQSISTLNFSPPQGASPSLDAYFTKLHKYLSISNHKNVSFRSIASVENKTKATWILRRSALFLNNSTVSLACFSNKDMGRLMCYHVVFQRDNGYVFFYPPVALTGVMDAFLVKNTAIAELMKSQFDLAWQQSIIVMEGGIPIRNGLASLVANDPSLASNTDFSLLSSTAI